MPIDHSMLFMKVERDRHHIRQVLLEQHLAGAHAGEHRVAR